MTFLSKFWQFLRVLFLRFYSDRLTYSASALTYTTLLALVPFLAVCMTILSAFPFFKNLGINVQQFIFQNFIPSSGQVVQQYLNSFIQQASTLSFLDTAFLVVTSISMMLTIERAINDIWKVHQRRQGFYSIVIYWAILSLAPIFIALSIAATSYLISLPLIAGVAAKMSIGKLLVGNLHLLITFLALAFLYIGVPNCKVMWRYGMVGALVSTFLFEWAKKLFVLYATTTPFYHHVYGALAAIPIFLLWLYVLWVIILLGALISNVLTRQFYGITVADIDGFSQSILWLEKLWHAQQKGEGLTITALYRQAPGNYEIDPHVMMAILEQCHLIKKISVNEYILSRDLSTFTLRDLYEQLPWKLSAKISANISPSVEKVLKKAHRCLDENLDVALVDLYG